MASAAGVTGGIGGTDFLPERLKAVWQEFYKLIPKISSANQF